MLLTRPPLIPQTSSRRILSASCARLACIRHAASVRPEPRSNSPKKFVFLSFCYFVKRKTGLFFLTLLVVLFSFQRANYNTNKVSCHYSTINKKSCQHFSCRVLNKHYRMINHMSTLLFISLLHLANQAYRQSYLKL